MTERRIEYLPLDEILSAERNPKDHDEAGIAASLRRFGTIEVITRDDRTGRLISGHGRTEAYRAARDAGEDPPDGVVVDEDGTWRIPVSVGWASEDDAEAEAALVAVNRLVERGGWKPDELAAILDDLRANDRLDLAVVRDDADLDVLLASLAQGGDLGPTNPDDEWVGMPEFDQQDRGSKYATTVHFASIEDAERFWREIFSEDKPHRTAWWPKHDGFVGSDQTTAYVVDDEVA